MLLDTLTSDELRGRTWGYGSHLGVVDVIPLDSHVLGLGLHSHLLLDVVARILREGVAQAPGVLHITLDRETLLLLVFIRFYCVDIASLVVGLVSGGRLRLAIIVNWHGGARILDRYRALCMLRDPGPAYRISVGASDCLADQLAMTALLLEHLACGRDIRVDFSLRALID